MAPDSNLHNCSPAFLKDSCLSAAAPASQPNSHWGGRALSKGSKKNSRTSLQERRDEEGGFDSYTEWQWQLLLGWCLILLWSISWPAISRASFSNLSDCPTSRHASSTDAQSTHMCRIQNGWGPDRGTTFGSEEGAIPGDKCDCHTECGTGFSHAVRVLLASPGAWAPGGVCVGGCRARWGSTDRAFHQGRVGWHTESLFW